MKRILFIVVLTIGMSMLAGCAEAPATKSVEVSVTATDVKNVRDWCQNIVDQRVAILLNVQTNPSVIQQQVKNMGKGADGAESMMNSGHSELANALLDISSAASEIGLYEDTHSDSVKSAKHFMRIRNLLNAAKVELDK
ncbi:hypothetical protein [Clostridium sp.]|uniref:hypothetical protein n=1 Tax=Clostridium sp. TaxID=1506 RepID=UPI001A4BF56A|nr:hypothetical protein [Clostridium sp.]MBK5234897.1 hypothetical protein [Clostridium sp.]